MRRGRDDRYDLSEARDLGQRGNAAPQALRSKNIEIDTVAVLDPLKDPNAKKPERVMAAVNRRVDILEYEHSHKRISTDAYHEGRLVQVLFERAGLSGGSTWNAGSRIDAEVAKEAAVLRRVRDARVITAMLKDLRNALGKVDAELLRQVLGENRKYADVVLPQRLVTSKTPGEKGVAYIAQRFRDALETLAREQRRR